jgi:hypothetical protein
VAGYIKQTSETSVDDAATSRSLVFIDFTRPGPKAVVDTKHPPGWHWEGSALPTLPRLVRQSLQHHEAAAAVLGDDSL